LSSTECTSATGTGDDEVVAAMAAASMKAEPRATGLSRSLYAPDGRPMRGRTDESQFSWLSFLQ